MFVVWYGVGDWATFALAVAMVALFGAVLDATAQAWFDRYKERFKVEPNIGAVYGQVGADLTVTALDRTGSDLTLENFILGMESVKGYQDIFNGPKLSFGREKHQGANSSFLAVVKGGRWVRVTDPLTY